MERGASGGIVARRLSLSLLCALVLVRAAGATCVGDCDMSGTVTQSDLDTAKAITLAQGGECPGLDVHSDGVDVGDVIVAVGNALGTCGGPTATPTVGEATVTPTLGEATPTPTSTSIGGTVTPTINVGNNVAGVVALAAKSMAGVPSLVAAISQGFLSGKTASLTDSGAVVVAADTQAAGDCPQGGSVSRSCSGVGSITLGFNFVDCAVSESNGTLTIRNTLTLTGGGVCPSTLFPPPLGPTATAVADLIADFRDQSQTITLTITVNLTASITSIALDTNGGCFIKGATFSLNGTLNSDVPGEGSTTATFSGTNVVFAVPDGGFNADCVPQKYSIVFGGGASLSQSTAPGKVDVTFNGFRLDVDASASPTQISMSGGLGADCLGGTASLTTVNPLTAIEGSLCPTGGKLSATVQPGGQMATILYGSDGGVEVDVNNDGLFDNSYSSCLDPALLECQQ